MRQLLIFVKEPVPGRVKTRLAAEIGADAACAVYRRCVERTLERLSALREESTLCVEPAEATGRIRAWLGSARPMQPQAGGTLGDRLTDATQRAFAGHQRPIVVIGTDSPWLDEALIEEAFTMMERADLVLGPTVDGGYYLIGLARPAAELFHGISWSTSQVLNQTLAAARRSGMVTSLLRPGYDIDRLDDLRRWMEADPDHGVALPIPARDAATPTMRR
jgi:rSAM/selenodomain-associated transferase 1